MLKPSHAYSHTVLSFHYLVNHQIKHVCLAIALTPRLSSHRVILYRKTKQEDKEKFCQVLHSARPRYIWTSAKNVVFHVSCCSCSFTFSCGDVSEMVRSSRHGKQFVTPAFHIHSGTQFERLRADQAGLWHCQGNCMSNEPVRHHCKTW